MRGEVARVLADARHQQQRDGRQHEAGEHHAARAEAAHAGGR